MTTEVQTVHASCGQPFDPPERADTEWLWPCGFPTGVSKKDKDGAHVPCRCMLPDVTNDWIAKARTVLQRVVQNDGGWGLHNAKIQCGFCEAVSGDDQQHEAGCLINEAKELVHNGT